MSLGPDLTGARWRKSSYSGGQGGECVEVAAVPGHVAVRDSKDPDGPALLFPAETFQAFIGRVTSGRLSAP